MDLDTFVPEHLELTLHCPPRDRGEIPSTSSGTPCAKRSRSESRLGNPYSPFACLAVSAQYLATGTSDGRVIIWSVEGRTPVEELKAGAETSRVCDVAWSPDGRHLVAGVVGEGGTWLWMWSVGAYVDGHGRVARELGSIMMKTTGQVKVDVCGMNGRREGDDGLVSQDSKHVRVLVTDMRGGHLYWLVAVPMTEAVGGETCNGMEESEGSFRLEILRIALPNWESPRPLVVDDRVEVFWKDNEENGKRKPVWFAGSVAQVDLGRKRMLVYYDDRQACWEDWDGPDALEWRREDSAMLEGERPAQGRQGGGEDGAKAARLAGERETLDNVAVNTGELAEMSINPTSSATAPTLLAVRCGKSFDHLAVLDCRSATLRLYSMLGPDSFRLIDEAKTNDQNVVPSHMSVSPDGQRLAITHPHGHIFVFAVNPDRVSALESPNKKQHQEVMHLSMVGFHDWRAPRGKKDAQRMERSHIWHTTEFAPDSIHIFCSLTMDTKQDKHGVLTWNHVENTCENMMVSANDGCPHVVLSMRAHRLVRPMQLFSMTASGLVTIWASRLYQNWSIIEPGFVSFERNRMHVEREDDWDLDHTCGSLGEVVMDQGEELDID